MSNSTDDRVPEADDEEVQPRLPDHTMSDEEVEGLEVEYSDRAPEDFVISGPLTSVDGAGPGRPFGSVAAALVWATRKYGPERIKQRIHKAEEGGRWALLIKGKK